MKKYILIGAIVTLFGGAIAYAYMLDSQTKPKTTSTSTSISSSTVETSENEETQNANQEKDETDTTKPDDEKSKIIGSASYTDYDLETFRSVADETRILFFYDSTHAPSKTLDNLLENDIENFPDDVHVFKVDYASEKDLVTELSVSQAATVLKYEDVDQLTGIYVANDTPDIASFRQILSLK